MTMIIYFIPCLLLAFGLFHIAQAALCLPTGRSVHAIQDIHGRRGMTERLQTALMPLARLISRIFPMSEYRKKRLEADFSQLHITQKPEDYVSNAKARSLLLALIGVFVHPDRGSFNGNADRSHRHSRVLSGHAEHSKARRSV